MLNKIEQGGKKWNKIDFFVLSILFYFIPYYSILFHFYLLFSTER